MKIALIGYGKMGKEIEDIAVSRKHTIVSTIDPTVEDATSKEISADSLQGADVVIEFTHPDVAVENMKSVLDQGVPMVVGTTGWYDELSNVQKLVESKKGTLLYGSNFSIGVNAFFKIIDYAASVFDNIAQYDVYAYELHHNQKADSPSGTAETIAKLLQSNVSRKKKLQFDRVNRRIDPDELHVASVRAGSHPGTHVVGFDSASDTIELKHTARDRSGFALGAVLAAEWVQKKKGLFTIEEFVDDLLKEN